MNRLTLGQRGHIALMFFPVMLAVLLAVIAYAGKPVNSRRL